jgi:hypothetical protein
MAAKAHAARGIRHDICAPAKAAAAPAGHPLVDPPKLARRVDPAAMCRPHSFRLSSSHHQPQCVPARRGGVQGARPIEAKPLSSGESVGTPWALANVRTVSRVRSSRGLNLLRSQVPRRRCRHAYGWERYSA